jgi:lipopolysaccharide transport system ATP-binding protein
MPPAIRVENLGKSYRLGLTHAGSVRELANRAAARIFRRNRLPTVSAPDADAPRTESDGLFWALRDVSFEVEPGDIVGVIGKNGAGKSTLLKILSRITPPTTGRAQIRGRVASLLEVGTGFHPELTGRENVFLNGTLLGMTRREVARKLDEIVAFAEVEQFLDTPVKRYSSGMYVRLAFAVAAHLDPEILIIDEVLAVGDAAFQEKCLGKMSDLGCDGRTVLFVSHNMAAVRQLTNECVFLELGNIAYRGPSKETVERYLARDRSEKNSSSNVADLPRVDWCGDRSIEFVGVELISPQGRRLQCGQSLGIQFSVRANEQIRGFALGITIHDDDGAPVGTGITEISRSLGPSESCAFELYIPDPGLAPRQYSLTLGIVRSAQQVVDVIQNALYFEVAGDGRLPCGFVAWNPGWGNLRLAIRHSLLEEAAVALVPGRV